MTEYLQADRYRELPSIGQWSARIKLDMPYDTFTQTIIDAALHTGQRLTGFITRDPYTGRVSSYTRTLYPRLKYGTTSPDEVQYGLDFLEARLGGEFIKEELPAGSFRTLLGLFAGQDRPGGFGSDDTPDYSPNEVFEQLQGRCSVYAGEVFTVRFGADGISTYAEPVAVVHGTTDLLPDIYRLGDQMKQERFSVEQCLPDGASTWLVETRHCVEPDALPPAARPS